MYHVMRFQNSIQFQSDTVKYILRAQFFVNLHWVGDYCVDIVYSQNQLLDIQAKEARTIKKIR